MLAPGLQSVPLSKKKGCLRGGPPHREDRRGGGHGVWLAEDQPSLGDIPELGRTGQVA